MKTKRRKIDSLLVCLSINFPTYGPLASPSIIYIIYVLMHNLPAFLLYSYKCLSAFCSNLLVDMRLNARISQRPSRLTCRTSRASKPTPPAALQPRQSLSCSHLAVNHYGAHTAVADFICCRNSNAVSSCFRARFEFLLNICFCLAIKSSSERSRGKGHSASDFKLVCVRISLLHSYEQCFIYI